MRTTRNTLFWLFLLVFGSGMAVMHYAEFFFSEIAPHDIDEQEISSEYHLINPLLFCQDQMLSKLSSTISDEIEGQVGDYIDAQKKSGAITDASVYYKDLNNGPWAIEHQDLQSAPASLLKVPMAMSVYHHAEKDPTFLNKIIQFAGGPNLNQGQYFQPSEQIRAGLVYSVNNLVKYMIEDSDNAALFLLNSMLDQKDMLDSYTKLGIKAPTTDLSNYTMDVRRYASFFRILYNASYVNRDSSEHLLSLLSNSTFDQGLEAGLPKHIVVAHKFGEASFNDGKVQLHDCGIVYRPKEPYLLCIMTHGRNFNALAKTIANISRTVYNLLEENKRH